MNILWNDYRDVIVSRRYTKDKVQSIVTRSLNNYSSSNNGILDDIEFEMYYFKDAKLKTALIGSNKNIPILVNTSYSSILDEEDEGMVITSYGGIRLIKPNTTDSDLKRFVEIGDTAVAEILYKKNEYFVVYVLYDVYQDVSEYIESVFEKIAKEIAIILKQEADGVSFLELENKEDRIKKVNALAQEMVLKQINEKRQNLNYRNTAIQTLQTELLKELRLREVALANLKGIEELEAVAKERVNRDILDIVNNDKVKDIQVKDNKFIVYTNPLTIYDNNDNPFYGGEFTIQMDLNEGRIRFFNEKTYRQGYWTNHDPHPHVNGDSGDACLGNVSSSIAEMINQQELYALTLICISFLESANENDPAGENIKHWDGYVNGIVISAEEYAESCGYSQLNDDEFICGMCEEITDGDYGYWIDERVIIRQDGRLDYEGGERHICEYCRDNNTEWDEEFEITAMEIIDQRPDCDGCGTQSHNLTTVYLWIKIDEDGNVIEYSDEADELCQDCLDNNAYFCHEADDYTYEVIEIEEEMEEEEVEDYV